MPWRPAPSIARGSLFPPSLPVIFAPIARSGSTTLFMGLALRYLSPVTAVKKPCALNSPVRSLVVVPEFPASITSSGSPNPESPFPSILTLPPSISIPIPSFLIAFAVDIVSSQLRKPLTSVVPDAIDPIIRDLCDTDLSPGGLSSPSSGFLFPLIISLAIAL